MSSDAAAIAADGANPHKMALGFGTTSQLHIASFHGIPVDSTTAVVGYTYSGDANLDGTVNSSDFDLLAANFGKTGQSWVNGDYNYDGTVNALDFNALASNYGQMIGSSADVPEDQSADYVEFGSIVPEPAVVLPVFGGFLIGRRGRRRGRT